MTTAPIRILLVDDEAAHVEAIRRALQRSSLVCSVAAAGSLADFRAAVARQTPDIALVDLNLPDGCALELLTTPLQDAPFPILVMTSHGTEQTAVEALKAGALDYVVKSPEAFADMARSVSRALREWGLIQERKRAEVALVAAKESAESASRAKSDFLALMSHELRTPLNGIMGGIQMLRSSELTPQQSACLDLVMTSAENQLSLVNDLLDLARLESVGVGVDADEFRLRHCIDQAVQLLRRELRDRGLTLTLEIGHDVPDLLIGDELRYRQILLKLIANAVKFTEIGGVTVRVQLVSRDGDDLLLRSRVIDTGIGVAAEQRELIFAPFVQADMSSTRKYGGSGLGLTLCQRLTESLGGRIWYESNPGPGSTFSFELPLRCREPLSAPAPAEVTPQQVDAGLRGLDILLADDDSACLKIFPAILAKLGARVVTAANGQQALERWRDSGPFHVILMDVQMPVLNGLEALRAIRRLEAGQGRRTPIIAQTAHAMKKDQQQLLAVGFDGYLAKPLMITEMVDLIKELVHAAPEGKDAALS